MRKLSGSLALVSFLLLIGGVALAQSGKMPLGTITDQEADQPIRKPSDRENIEEEDEDALPEPPPFFGEDGNAGEKMKIVWNLDRSGSMAWAGGTFVGPDGTPTTGSKWDRAKAETIIALSQLTPEWEFGIVTYACNRSLFEQSLVEATPDNIARATAWLEGQRPFGGTGIGPAQKEAFELLSRSTVEGPGTGWLLSDGCANCGARDDAAHLAVALSGNHDGHVLNTIGIGGACPWLLQKLAEATGGTYTHVN